jgi:hypothetical protein
MIKSLKGIPTKDIPFIENEILAISQSGDPKWTKCDEIIAFGKKHLISWLKLLGNKKMLKRVRSEKHKFYLLLFNYSEKSLKMVALPNEVNQIQKDLAA